jgi:hypothetical protein
VHPPVRPCFGSIVQHFVHTMQRARALVPIGLPEQLRQPRDILMAIRPAWSFVSIFACRASDSLSRE